MSLPKRGYCFSLIALQPAINAEELAGLCTVDWLAKISFSIDCGKEVQIMDSLKVACRVQIWKKHFVKIVKSLVTVSFKMTLHLCIYFAFTKKKLF